MNDGPRLVARGNLPWMGLAAAFAIAVASHLLTTVTNPLQILALVLLLVSVLALRRDVVTLGVIALFGIVIDYYQLIALPKGFPFVALLTMLVLIALLWYERRGERPWQLLPDLPLWAALLVLVALAIPRSVSVKVGVVYFLGVIAAAFCAWILGTVVVTNGERLRLLLNVLTVLGVFIALHAILSERFGIFLFDTPAHAAYLRGQHDFYFLVNHYYRPPARASSFLENPDSLGALLAMLLFLPGGLFFAARATWERLLYFGATCVIAIALLFTYTAAAWIAALVGVVALIALAVRPRYAAPALAGAVALGLVGSLLFRSEVQRLLAHATAPNELTLRTRIWQTALKIIAANPLTGIGLGVGQPFIQRSAPYAVGMNIGLRDHPHNSFLELAALAGIPVLLVYLAILIRAAMRAARHYHLASWEYRPLLGGVFAALVALTVHGLADATWTLPPLVPIAWMLVGAISSRQFTTASPETSSAVGTVAQPVRYPATPLETTPPLPRDVLAGAELEAHE